MAIDPTTIGLGIGQGLLGLALTDYNDQRQLQQQQKLTDMQKKANMQLADYNQGLALDSWNKTNYEAQRKHMERAGLSVGMMYKGGGPGGQAIAGTAQGVSGAQAPTGGRELERWRKKYKKSITHWLITELGHGHTEHVHIHGILFTDHKKDINEIWGYGYTFLGSYVNERTVNYVMKYVTKIDFEHKQYIPIILTSPGIGRNYVNRLDAKLDKFNPKGPTKETYTTSQGPLIS